MNYGKNIAKNTCNCCDLVLERSKINYLYLLIFKFLCYG